LSLRWHALSLLSYQLCTASTALISSADTCRTSSARSVLRTTGLARMVWIAAGCAPTSVRTFGDAWHALRQGKSAYPWAIDVAMGEAGRQTPWWHMPSTVVRQQPRPARSMAPRSTLASLPSQLTHTCSSPTPQPCPMQRCLPITRHPLLLRCSCAPHAGFRTGRSVSKSSARARGAI